MNNIVDNIRGMNPNPKDKYPDLTPKQWAEATYAINETTGLIADKVFGVIGREAWDACCNVTEKQLSSIQSAGVWRKASEKKPWKDGLYSGKYNDRPVLLIFENRELVFLLNDDGTYFRNEIEKVHFDILYWLDPTPIPVSGEGSDWVSVGLLMARMNFWTKRYRFSFQFWGPDNNNVYIEKDNVEVASFGGEDSPRQILERVLEWCEKSNPRIKYPPDLAAR